VGNQKKRQLRFFGGIKRPGRALWEGKQFHLTLKRGDVKDRGRHPEELSCVVHREKRALNRLGGRGWDERATRSLRGNRE